MTDPVRTIDELRTAVSDPRAAASLTVPELQRLRAWGEYQRAQKAEARARAECESAENLAGIAADEFRKLEEAAGGADRAEAEAKLRRALHRYRQARENYNRMRGSRDGDWSFLFECAQSEQIYKRRLADFEKRFGPVVKESLTTEPERQ